MSFAISTASSSVLNVRTATTGPKISSLNTLEFVSGFMRTVGKTNAPLSPYLVFSKI